MPIDRITLVNRALARCGLGGIESFDEDTDLAQTAGVLYLEVVEGVLGAAPWACTLSDAELVRLATPPASSPYAFAFQLPADRIAPPRTVRGSPRDRPTTAFDVRGDVLLSDLSGLWIEYQRLVEPAELPPYLRTLIARTLAAEFAGALASNQGLRQTLDYEAFGAPSEMRMGGLMGQALLLEAQSKPSRTVAGGDAPLLFAFGAEVDD